MKKYEPENVNGERLRALTELDDKRFAEVLSSIAENIGMSDKNRDALLANSTSLKRMLASASDSDLRRLASGLGKEKTDTVLEAIERTKKEEKD